MRDLKMPNVELRGAPPIGGASLRTKGLALRIPCLDQYCKVLRRVSNGIEPPRYVFDLKTGRPDGWGFVSTNELVTILGLK